MKKLFSILAIAFCLVLSNNAKAQATVSWPAGAATNYTIAATGAVAIAASNNNIYNATIPTLTGNITVTVTKNAKLRAGAILSMVIKTTGSETTTFAGDIVAPVVTGSAGKTWSQSFIFNGTKYYPCGAKIQVD